MYVNFSLYSLGIFIVGVWTLSNNIKQFVKTEQLWVYMDYSLFGNNSMLFIK